MNKLTELTQHIKSLSKKEAQQSFLVTIAVIALSAAGTSYYIYNASSELTRQIKQLNRQTHKIRALLAQSKNLKQEEENIRTLLDKHPDFAMRTYFEKFYTKHNIKPEQNWKPDEGPVIEGSEAGIKFQEIILQATFKNQTMKKLVTVLQDIYDEPIIYLKEVDIAAENSKISFELTLATKQIKKELGETE